MPSSGFEQKSQSRRLCRWWVVPKLSRDPTKHFCPLPKKTVALWGTDWAEIAWHLAAAGVQFKHRNNLDLFQAGYGRNEKTTSRQRRAAEATGGRGDENAGVRIRLRLQGTETERSWEAGLRMLWNRSAAVWQYAKPGVP